MSHYYPRHVSGLDMPILRRNNCTNTASGMLLLNCALKLVEEIILYYDARSKKHKKNNNHVQCHYNKFTNRCRYKTPLTASHLTYSKNISIQQSAVHTRISDGPKLPTVTHVRYIVRN